MFTQCPNCQCLTHNATLARRAQTNPHSSLLRLQQAHYAAQGYCYGCATSRAAAAVLAALAGSATPALNAAAAALNPPVRAWLHGVATQQAQRYATRSA